MFFLYSLYRISDGIIRLKCWNEISCVLDCLLVKSHHLGVLYGRTVA